MFGRCRLPFWTKRTERPGASLLLFHCLLMAWELLWLLFLRSFACPAVSCVSNLPANECFKQDADAGRIELQSCGSGLTCEFNQMANMQAYDFRATNLHCTPTTLKGRKFPGEACETAEDCLSLNCTHTSCQGLPQSSVCSDFADCSPGLICWNGFCTPQIALGGPCTASWQCANNALCAQSHCVRFYSQPLGQAIIDTPQVCESGYETQGKCAVAPSNVNRPDEQCYQSTDCRLSSGKSGECWCGFNTAEMAFCSSQPGDEEFLMLKDALLATIETSTLCHFNTSLTTRCPQQAKDPTFLTYQTALYIYYYRPVIISAPVCILEVMPFAQNYSYAYSSVQPGDRSVNSANVIGAVVGVFMGALCIGSVCFYCIRRYVKQGSREITVLSRVRNEDLIVVEIFTGKIPTSPPIIPLEAQFTFSDLQLSEQNCRYLKMGIPVTLPAEEQLGEIEEVRLVEPRHFPRLSTECTVASPHSAKVRPSF